MTQLTLMVLRTDPEKYSAIADAFAAHDKTDLPLLLGARSRTLFRFHDLYLHLVESDDVLVPKLRESHQDARFMEINNAIAPLVRPYRPESWTGLHDNVAAQIYHHSWSR
jgi:Polyketide synthesis cyclase